MFEFFNNILKLWQSSSKSQRSGLIAFFLLLIVCVGLYERWTAGFRLSKLERSAKILQTVSQVPDSNANVIASISKSITNQLEEIVGTEQPVSKGHSPIVRFLVGLVPWFVIGLLFFRSSLRKDRREFSAAYGAWGFGTFFSLLSMFLPEGRWPWLHILVYPILSLIIFVGFVMVIATSSSGKKKKEEIEPDASEQSLGASSRKAADGLNVNDQE